MNMMHQTNKCVKKTNKRILKIDTTVSNQKIVFLTNEVLLLQEKKANV